MNTIPTRINTRPNGGFDLAKRLRESVRYTSIVVAFERNEYWSDRGVSMWVSAGLITSETIQPRAGRQATRYAITTTPTRNVRVMITGASRRRRERYLSRAMDYASAETGEVAVLGSASVVVAGGDDPPYLAHRTQRPKTVR